MLGLLLLAQVASFYIQPGPIEAGLLSTRESIVLRKCVVNGTAYSHSQAIESGDLNCHCLCVAGDIYCWWENYKAINDSNLSMDDKEISDPVIVDHSKVKDNAMNFTDSAKISCFVMGKEYEVGEIFPHSTGNCIECSCGAEGHIECSPRDCFALRSPDSIQSSQNINHDINDNQPESFSNSREHGIDENF